MPTPVIGYSNGGLEDRQEFELMPKKALSCKYNQECWMKHRLPLIRKYKIYLPYECSFVAMGDMEKCTLRDGFIERERLKGVKELNDSLPTAGTIE